jgi:hypothetical protein
MPDTNHPPKQIVREYLKRRARATKPPPAPEEIRRQLGWGLPGADIKLTSRRA